MSDFNLPPGVTQESLDNDNYSLVCDCCKGDFWSKDPDKTTCEDCVDELSFNL
jgi:hypothetical protein